MTRPFIYNHFDVATVQQLLDFTLEHAQRHADVEQLEMYTAKCATVAPPPFGEKCHITDLDVVRKEAQREHFQLGQRTSGQYFHDVAVNNNGQLRAYRQGQR